MAPPTIRTAAHPRIITRDIHGTSNGFVVPVFSVHDGWLAPAQYPQQVFLTVVSPGTVKGPHLHMKRWGLFTCIKGNVKIVVRTGTGYEEFLTGDAHEFLSVQVPAGVPAALQNIGTTDAYLLNLPAPAWSADEADDHPVTFDGYSFDFSRAE
jgi:dTDP-4-dehydrorhamnose 3,5-epimerase-like enzyme